MQIIESTIEKLEDPFGILTGERFEVFLTLDIDEDDELYSEQGTMLKLILATNEAQTKIVQYDFIERETNKVLDFALEEEETQEIEAYCHTLVERYTD